MFWSYVSHNWYSLKSKIWCGISRPNNAWTCTCLGPSEGRRGWVWQRQKRRAVTTQKPRLEGRGHISTAGTVTVIQYGICNTRAGSSRNGGDDYRDCGVEITKPLVSHLSLRCSSQKWARPLLPHLDHLPSSNGHGGIGRFLPNQNGHKSSLFYWTVSDRAARSVEIAQFLTATVYSVLNALSSTEIRAQYVKSHRDHPLRRIHACMFITRWTWTNRPLPKSSCYPPSLPLSLPPFSLPQPKRQYNSPINISRWIAIFWL